MFGLTFQEMLIVGIIAIVLFGRNLPEVARKLGQQYAKFRKGLNDLQAQVNLHEIYDPKPSYSSSKSSYKSYSSFDDHDEATAPRFEPPPASEPTPAEPRDPSAAA